MEDCRAFAERQGWEVADVFEDVDISAFNTKAKRPAFLRMLDELRAGELDGIVVWKLDRLTRQQRDLVRVMEACEVHKAFVASVTEPINTGDSIGQFVAELLVAQARMESANTSLRQRRKAKEQREQGAPPYNGKRCFGYDTRYTTVIEEEAALIREAKDRILAGESLASVCNDWNARQIKTTGGRGWRIQFLRRLLISPTLAAHRELEGKLYPGKWEPILSIEDHRRLNAFFDARRKGTRPATVGLLIGCIRCGECGQRMYSSRRNDKVRRYVCRAMPGTGACGRTTIKAEPLEELVAEMLFLAVDDASLRARLESHTDQDDGLIDVIRGDEEGLESLAKDFYLDRLLTRDEFVAARSALTERLERNRAELAKRTGSGAVGRFMGHGEMLRTAWADSNLEWRRSIVAAVFERVEILPGRAGRLPFDPRRVRAIWKY